MAFHFGLPFFDDEFDGLLEGDAHRVAAFGERDIFLVVQDVRAETSRTDGYGRTFKSAEVARKFEQFEGLFQSDGFQALPVLHLGEPRFLLILCRSDLHHRAETPDFDKYRFSALRVRAQQTFAHFMLGFGIEGFFHLRFEVAIEVFHHLRPFRFSFCDVVELLFHLGREVIIHDFGEIL